MGFISVLVMLPFLLPLGFITMPIYILSNPIGYYFDVIRPIIEFILSHH